MMRSWTAKRWVVRCGGGSALVVLWGASRTARQGWKGHENPTTNAFGFALKGNVVVCVALVLYAWIECTFQSWKEKNNVTDEHGEISPATGPKLLFVHSNRAFEPSKRVYLGSKVYHGEEKKKVQKVEKSGEG